MKWFPAATRKVFYLVSFFLINAPIIARAANGPAGGGAGQPAGTTAAQEAYSQLRIFGQDAGVETQKTLPEIIGLIIRSLLGLLGIFLVVLIIYAGYLYMTSQGEEDKVKKAKDLIKNAVIGLILIALAYSIANFVIKAITAAR